mmetsp:Transcript_36288/g.87897  ORF Transcript_36288/g.87897 Transcript_36288/m.87897 type:complete len:977 (+) Transcript_36288:29-2959(+)|eukprot:CAMPEP_0113631372 /NCGR_PEP_ID=MMETSP0017_2-20120614/16303_1 /TAXON_ID=2856 /ORGANISM="Cylindrotheca closterium" /LENGTH=976 /DNA_ID=CAMNT_0000541879 /DNA_START=29 /DNA_END=2959 /DNA_ORIENTATION=+ /assembly_acc=CAM_ASM_000147
MAQFDLRQVLAQTLSPYADARKQAEAQLNQASKQPGHAMEVVRLVASADAADAAVRQSAAVHFKNLIKKGWDESKDEADRHGIVISGEDRITVKKHLVELMCTVPPQIQAQVSESISLIAGVDFPKKWEYLLPELVQKMQSPDLAVVNGCLMTVNAIFKRFRYVQRSDALYADLIFALNHMQQPLLIMFVQTGKQIEASQNDPQKLTQLFESLRLMCRIFFSLNFQDLPEFFEDHMKEWMDEFAKYLQYTNPLLVDADEETDSSPIDKLQAAIIENIKIYADKDEEPFIPFLPDFTKLVWNLLIGLTTYPKHDRLTVSSIKFLSSLVEKKMHNNLFQERSTLEQIVTSIVIPNLMVREADEEKFEDDPQEYILTEIEGSDSESRRKVSRDLLRAMCRQFEVATTEICKQHIADMLAQSARDPSKWAAKDAAIHLMLGTAIRLESHQGVSELNENVNMLEFFSTQVFSELQDTNHSNRPMVKATALKFVCTFRKQFTREQLISLLPLLIAHLGSPSIVVHTLAGYGIERILMTSEVDPTTQQKRYKISRVELQPLLESLFTGLFGIIDNTEWNENEHVMKCTMRALSRAGEDVVPITGIVFNKLAAALERVCKNPRNPSYNHYLFESIAALVRNVCSKDASQTAQLEALLFPPFQIVLQMDISEFTPYVFQVLAQLLEYRPKETGLGEAYTSLFAPLLTPSLWERKGNVPGLVRLLTAYLKMSAADLVAGGHLRAFLGIFQKLIASKATEASSIELLTAITIYVPIDQLREYLNTIFRLILTKLAQGKSNKFPVLAIQYFALFSGLHGGQAIFDCLNGVSPGAAMSLLVQIWSPKAKNAAYSLTSAKTQAVGLTRLLCETPALLADDNVKKIWAQTFASVVGILSSNTFSANDVDADEPEIEIAYDASYSQLSLATKKAHDPFPHVADPMAMFKESLEQLNTAHPGVLSPIVQLGVSSDPKIASGFQSICQRTGLRL